LLSSLIIINALIVIVKSPAWLLFAVISVVVVVVVVVVATAKTVVVLGSEFRGTSYTKSKFFFYCNRTGGTSLENDFAQKGFIMGHMWYSVH
jgi:hypothetical protein